MKNMPRATSVTEYIAAAPPEFRGKLKELRKIIKTAAPKAEEKISYGMPYYAYNGRLAYFMLATHHIGLYIPTPTVEEHAADLRGYEVSKATIRLPHEKKLPVTLIRKLISSRVRRNESMKKK